MNFSSHADAVRPYGSWPSTITTDLIVTDAVRFGQIQTEGANVYWIEGRPDEGGRNVLVRHGANGLEDLTPPGFGVRTRAHEYGGGDFCVHGGAVFFSNEADQRLYRHENGARPTPITPEGSCRYADSTFDARRNRILCVVEDHGTGASEPTNAIAAVGASDMAAPAVLIDGRDFVSNPVLDPDGDRLAWLAWDHPRMPWQCTELWTGRIAGDGRVADARCIAGGSDESIFQPRWSPDGRLYFVSDRNGWWNLYRWSDDRIEPVVELRAEMGLPQWVFGMSTYDIVPDGSVAIAVNEAGVWHLMLVDDMGHRPRRVHLPYSDISQVHATDHAVVFCAGSPREPEAIVAYRLSTQRHRVLRHSHPAHFDADVLSFPQHVEFATGRDEVAHGFYYPPAHPECVGPEGETPPLIVHTHGGPTAAESTALNLRIQFWTSRGFAVLAVNYRGSTGFGRSYREALSGQWGVYDVDDCVAGAAFLVEQRRADPDRLIIRGGSAGGYTALAALTFRNVFRAGAVYYGISDLEALAGDTHKFESRYLDGLVGPYPDAAERYRERSPIHHADRLSCPIIFFQGLDDKVVPPNQAEAMVNALKRKGLPVAYLAFPDEAHGFRRAENIKLALDTELYFYTTVFGIDRPDDVEPIDIYNLQIEQGDEP